MNVDFLGSASYDANASNFQLTYSNLQTGGVVIGLPPTDNFVLQSYVSSSNGSNIQIEFGDESNTLTTLINHAASNISLLSNDILISTCNVSLSNNSNHEVSFRRRFGQTRFYLDNNIIYDHQTPWTFDEQTGNFSIVGVSKSNEIGIIKADDIQVTQIETKSNMVEYMESVKFNSPIYCDQIITNTSNFSTSNIITNVVTTSNITTSNITTSNITTSNITTNLVTTCNITTSNITTSNITTCNITTSNIVSTTATFSNITAGTLYEGSNSLITVYALSNSFANSQSNYTAYSNFITPKLIWTSNTLSNFSTDSNGEQTITIVNNTYCNQVIQQTGKTSGGQDFIKWLFSAIGSAAVSTTITLAANNLTVGGKTIMDWGADGMKMMQNTLTGATLNAASNLIQGYKTFRTVGGRDFLTVDAAEKVSLLADYAKWGPSSVTINGDSNTIIITDSNANSNVYLGLNKCFMMSNLGIGTQNPNAMLHLQGTNGAIVNSLSGGSVINAFPLHYILRCENYDITASSNQLYGGVALRSYNTVGSGIYNFPERALIGLSFVTRNALSSNVEALNIKHNGDVGIGYSNPSYKLDVNGTARATTLMEGSSNLVNKYALSNHTHDFSSVYTLSNTMSNYALTSVANVNYAPSNALSNYALTSVANVSYAPSNALSNYTLTSVANVSYAPSNALSNYVLTSTANSTYALSNTMSNYLLTSVADSNYAPSNQLQSLSNAFYNGGAGADRYWTFTNSNVCSLSNVCVGGSNGDNAAFCVDGNEGYYGNGAAILLRNRLSTNANTWAWRVGCFNSGPWRTYEPDGYLSLADKNGYKMFVGTNGRFGFGTCNMNYTIDVVGNINATTGLFVNGTSTDNKYWAINNRSLVFNQAKTTWQSEGIVLNGCYAGGSTTNSNFFIARGNDDSSKDQLVIHTDSSVAGAGVNFMTNNGQTRLFIKSADGRVGIGNSNPSYTLDVRGDVRSTGDWYWSPSKNFVCSSTGNDQEFSVDLMNQNTYTGNSWQVWSDKTGVGSIITAKGDSGRVGVGTSNPSYKFEVTTANGTNGFAHTVSNVTLASWIHTGSAYQAQFGTMTNHGLGFYVNNQAPSLAVSTNGTVVVNADLTLNNRGQTLYIQPGLSNTSSNTAICQYDIPGNATHLFWDNVWVTGNMSAYTKNFIIPHPMDSNLALIHSCVEAPRLDLMYSGIATLKKGRASINIDIDSCPNNPMTKGTFEALTRNARVFLQNNDTFDRVKGKVVGGMLQIECENDKSNDDVHWLIISERKDDFVMGSTNETTNEKGHLKTERPKRDALFDHEMRPSKRKKDKE